MKNSQADARAADATNLLIKKIPLYWQDNP
jgi:hypothetical protein